MGNDNMVGAVFGELTVLSKDVIKRKWVCKCSCGVIKSIYSFNLKNGSSKSCGCKQKELARGMINNARLFAKGRSTLEEFVSSAARVHGDKYDYSFVKYVNCETNIKIMCRKCQNPWESKPRNHLSGKGCPVCAVSGYKTSLRGCLYILQHEGTVKIGITNRSAKVRANHVGTISGIPFEVAREYWFDNGKTALAAETHALSILRKIYEHPEQKFEGSTECFVCADTEYICNIVEEFIRNDYE